MLPEPGEQTMARGYATRPNRAELIAVLLAGALHVGTEIALSERAAVAYNLAVSVGFAGYLLWRWRRSQGAARAWGMRVDNFGPAIAAYGALSLVAGVILVGYGVASGPLFLPRTFWMTLAVYPVWGIAQQFALQSLVARNLAGLFSSSFTLAVVAAGLFALAHYPRLELVGLTFAAGFFLTLAYRRFPNLWAVGIVHGVMGSLTFYVVLRQDPGREILELVGVS